MRFMGCSKDNWLGRFAVLALVGSLATAIGIVACSAPAVEDDLDRIRGEVTKALVDGKADGPGPASTEATLTGETRDGTPITGTDSVVVDLDCD